MHDTSVIYTSIDSPIGRLLLTSDGTALCGIYMESHKRGPEPRDDWRQDAEPFRLVADELVAYFAGRLRRFDVPVVLRGTEFQRRACASCARSNSARRAPTASWRLESAPRRRSAPWEPRSAQPHLDHRPLPPRRRLNGPTDRFRRRPGPQTLAFGPRRG